MDCLRLPSVSDVPDGFMQPDSPFVTRPVLYVDKNNHIEKASELLVASRPPCILVCVLSEGTSNCLSIDERTYLNEGVGRILQQCDAWLFTNAIAHDSVVKQVTNAVRKVLIERDYTSRHYDFIRENQGQLDIKPTSAFKLVAVNEISAKDRAIVDVNNIGSEISEGLCESVAKLDCWHSNYVLQVKPDDDESSVYDIDFLVDFFVSVQKRESIRLIDEQSENQRYVTIPVVKKIKSQIERCDSTTGCRPMCVGLFCASSVNSLASLARLLKSGVPCILLPFTTNLCQILSETVNIAKLRNLDCTHFVRLFHKRLRVISDVDVSTYDADLQVIHASLRLLTVCNMSQPLPNVVMESLVDSAIYDLQPLLILGLLTQLSCVHIAHRFRVLNLDKMPGCGNLVLQSLLYPERNGMLKYFLESGVQLSSFYNFQFMDLVMRYAHNQDFMQTVVLGHLLGYPCTPHDTRRLLGYELDELLKSLTTLSNLFPADLLYAEDCNNTPYEKEGNVIDAMAIFSVLMNRGELAKLLWAYSHDPVPLAIVLAHLASKLALHCKDWYFYETNLNEIAKDFSDLAVNLLSESHIDSPHRSYDVLCYSFEKYGRRTAMQLAFEAGNKQFIAHECCQRFVSRQMFGNIQFTTVRDTMFATPTWLKTILCSVFVLPVCWWVQLRETCVHAVHQSSVLQFMANNNQPVRSTSGGLIEMEHMSTIPVTPSTYSLWSERIVTSHSTLTASPSIIIASHKSGEEEGDIPDGENVALKSPSRKRRHNSMGPCNLMHRIRSFYTTPLAKFWLSLLFRLAHLVLFGLTIAVPGCGNIKMDLTVWLWSFFTWVESLWVLLCRAKSMSIRHLWWHVVNTVIVAILLALMLIFKIVIPQPNVRFAEVFIGRVIASCFMLYLCYSTVFTYIPMSATLGPLLVRVKLMVTRDLVNYLILVTLIMGSSAIVVHVIVHPDFPNTPKLWHEAFHWAFFTLFTTDISDLKPSSSSNCVGPHIESQEYCLSTSSATPANCPRTGWMAYFVVVQYLVIIKLISWPLLFALFANSAKEWLTQVCDCVIFSVDDEADSIWKLQLFELVNEFDCHPVLPPPLTPFACILWFLSMCPPYNPPSDAPDNCGNVIRLGKHRHNEYYCYWRGKAIEMYNKAVKSEKPTDEQTLKNINERLKNISVLLHDSDC